MPGVRGTEHVKRVGQSSLELQVVDRLECVGQHHQPSLAIPQPFFAHPAVRIEYQLPQMSLPSLSLAHRINVGSPGGAPSPDHTTPRYRVFAKKPRQLRSEQERSELDVGVSFGSTENVVARGLQAGVVAMVRA